MKKKCWAIFLMIVLLAGIMACGKGQEQEGTGTFFEGNDSAGLPDPQKMVWEDIVFGDGFSADETDVVIVMDESGSMAYADKERVAVEAAKMFIDMEKASGSNLALVEFSNQVTSTGLIEIKQEQNKTYLKQLLDQIPYGGKAHTDTGAALQEAVSILNHSESAGKKAILLFTDGRTDIDVGTPGRTIEDSLADVDAAMEEARRQGYPIYSVGLNADGSVEEKELSKLAANTGGDYRIAWDVNELPDFFNQIFMEMRSISEIGLDEFVADGDYRDIGFTIENSSIMEANIVILHSNKLMDAKVYDPQRDEVAEDDARARFSTSERYTVIKLLKPQTGKWNLRVRGISGDNIRISLLYHYDFTVITTLSSQEINLGDTVNIDLYLASEGVPMKGEEFYQTVSAKALVKSAGNGSESELEFTSSEEGLHSSYTPDGISDYTLNIHLEGDGFYRDVENITIHVRSGGAVQIKEFEPFRVTVGETISVDLTEYISGQEENGYSISNASDIIKASVENHMLILEGIETGDTVLELSVSGSGGNKTVYPIEVECIAREMNNLLPVIAAVAAAVLLLCILAIRKSRRRIDGKFVIGVRCRREENGVADGNDYTIPTGIEGRNFNASKLSLEDLLSMFRRYYSTAERDEKKKQELGIILSDIRRYTKQIVIKGHKKSGHIKIQSKAGDTVKICNEQGMEEGKAMEINVNTGGNMQLQGRKGCNVRVTIPGGYVEVTIRYSMV